ncbi:FxsB family cyclophane-forming radical SAM/SPASM peptide maturase [Nonomuraea fuscirosea]|uniref:FxsB family cyclophane-forming radical SAM/SPASM peptide maturase n=1 Tax=Nonomuraea fuscirosea TaxID=1291556 RepID=UPI00347FFA23
MKSWAAGFRQFVIKVASRCDLACDHCYMYEHVDQGWRLQPRFMSDEIAQAIAGRIADHAAFHDLRQVRVVLHGGEPLLAGPARLDAIAAHLRSAVGPRHLLDLHIQTNGVLLDERFCEVFARNDIKVGISLDGDRTANDRHRRYADGRSSFDQAVRAIDLLRERHRELYSGLLCTIDLANDPIEVYKSLVALEPPDIDFLLPHATWDRPPPRPDGDAVAYGSWLIEIFDQWIRDGRPTQVRIFDSLLKMRRGGSSLSEALGLDPTDLLVIETNGDYERSDALKTSFEGAARTGMNVLSHDLDQVAAVTADEQAFTLSSTCRSCPVLESCGGGLPAHRYKSGSGFANPSVYCADLFSLITHVAENAPKHVPQGLSGADFEALASGRFESRTLTALLKMQSDARRALVATAARRCGPAGAASWSLLLELDQAAPQIVTDLLARPYVRSWATDGLVNAGYLAELALTAAVEAGIGSALDGPAGRTDDSRDIRAGALRLRIDDHDPYRACYGTPVAQPLSRPQLDDLRSTVTAAWHLIEREHPHHASDLTTVLNTITPLAPYRSAAARARAVRSAPGAIGLSIGDDLLDVASQLVRENRRTIAGLALDAFDLVHPKAQHLAERFTTAYAANAMLDFWRAHTGHAPVRAGTMLAHWASLLDEAVRDLLASTSLTKPGRRFVTTMRDAATTHF